MYKLCRKCSVGTVMKIIFYFTLQVQFFKGALFITVP